METIFEKLKKIEALARAGVGGERENAERMLQLLCEKHGISLEDIARPDRKEVHFSFKNVFERRLLIQVVAYVTRTGEVTFYTRKSKKMLLYFDLTAAETVDVRECFDHYRKEWEIKLEDFFSAFLHRNRIFAPSAPLDDQEETPEDQARIDRIVQMMRGIDQSRWEKTLKLEMGRD